jgi:hypothetical protein
MLLIEFSKYSRQPNKAPSEPIPSKRPRHHRPGRSFLGKEPQSSDQMPFDLPFIPHPLSFTLPTPISCKNLKRQETGQKGGKPTTVDPKNGFRKR